MQTLSQGMDRLAPTLVKLLADMTGAKGILARNDPKVRKLEGLDQKVDVLLRRGARDDRPSTRPASPTPSIRGTDRRPGCFSISARTARRRRATRTAGCSTASATTAASGCVSRRSATSVEALDVSADAVERITANAAANGIGNMTAARPTSSMSCATSNAHGARYDTIVLDPPAFAKNKASIPNAAGRLQGNQPPRPAAAGSRRVPGDLQLLVQRRRGHVRRDRVRGLDRRP